MYKYVTPGLGLFLLSLFVSFFPHWFVLRNYEKEHTDFPGSVKLLIAYLFQVAWFFISVILGVLLWASFAKGNLSQVFAVLSMFYPSMAFPPALFSAVTGIYPVLTRRGYDYFKHSKNLLRQTAIPTHGPHLKLVGWLQSILLPVITGVSLLHILR
jgi:hypothetical protein